jgi:hypothetical protein
VWARLVNGRIAAPVAGCAPRIGDSSFAHFSKAARFSASYE